MSLKRKIKFHLSLLFVFFLFASCGESKQEQQNVAESNRTKFNLNVGWKFIKSNPEQANQVGFDDANWEDISCPHTFNDVDTFDDLSHGHHDGEDNQWRGTVWYRKHFQLPDSNKGKKVFIEFESVRQIADVYINGVRLGQNQTGFIPFGYDLTPYFKFGEDNIIAVKVNNDRGDHFRDNFPLVWNHEHWHPTHGGIYRNVFLHTMDPLHITLPLYDNLETLGNYVYAENISETSADITVETEIQNDYSEDKRVSVITQVVDNSGKVVATSTTEKNISSGDKVIVNAITQVKNPKLWYTRHPYMYSVITAIKADGKIIDSHESPLGIRNFEFNKDSGFIINGENVKLHGWGQKPTNSWAGLGAALPDWLRDYTFQLMDEAGGNFIRWGHCASSPAEVDMGDKYGFVTLMPGVSGESQDEGETWDIRIKAFKDLIVYYRNHPSIFIWEGGNWAETEAHYKEILEVIDTFDPKGKRLMGNRRADVKNDSEGYVSIEIGTEGWEREYPDLPIVESEYNREEAPRRIWDTYSPDDYFYSHPNIKKNTYKLSSEEFAVRQADHWWNKMGKKAYHVGGANWVFTDGPHGGRCPTEVTRASGEVDAVRLPKEAFYALKAMWRPEPQVHIVGHWNYEPGTKKPMYVMSNCAAVKLYVNDKLIGTNNTPENGYVFKFDDVAWEAGEIRAEAFIDDALKTSQTKETAGEPAALKLTSITGPEGWMADGSDIALVDVEVVDASGKRCPLAKGRVNFTISGPAIWRGGYNSGKPNTTNNLFLDIEAGINRVAVRSVLEAGSVTITAKQEGVKDASITLESLPIELENGLTTRMPQVFIDVLTEEPLPAYTPEIPEYVPGVKNRSDLFKKFSYTGDGKAVLRTNMHWGKKAYTDLEYNYTHLPRYLNKAEYVRPSNLDNRYWARDQLQFIAGKKMHIYVLHDDTVPRPDFLLQDYKDNGDNVFVGEVVMSVFHRVAEAGESIIMAGNSDGDTPVNCRMYTVMAKQF
ncbi:glycoside hydrolase family 2 protein [Algibacter sp. Ld11]|uniref:glycoside hydrolase family 2 protein n=1 Tax=Algibacter sp. Ld11 TaxID=649150 RepID=UPI00386F2414